MIIDNVRAIKRDVFSHVRSSVGAKFARVSAVGTLAAAEGRGPRVNSDIFEGRFDRSVAGQVSRDRRDIDEHFGVVREECGQYTGERQ